MALWLRATGEAQVVWPHLSWAFPWPQLDAMVGGRSRPVLSRRRLGEVVLLVGVEAKPPLARRNLIATTLAGEDLYGDVVLLTGEEFSAVEDDGRAAA